MLHEVEKRNSITGSRKAPKAHRFDIVVIGAHPSVASKR
jgi:hypothetical protein